MRARYFFVAAVAVLWAASVARAETNPWGEPSAAASDPSASAPAEPNPFAAPPMPAASSRPPRWGLNWNLGWGGARGDMSSLLEKPMSGELNIFGQHGPWRFGVGLNFASMTMKSPYQNENEWGFQQTYLSAERFFRTEGTFRPYLQVRGGLARLHPRSQIFNVDPLPEGYVLGNSTTKASNGFSVNVVPGFEWRLNGSVAIDASASFGYYSVDEVDLTRVGLAPASSGSLFEGRIGVRWHPDDGYPAGPATAGSPDRPRDAWGVGKNYGWAAGEVLAINMFSSAFNEYKRNGNFNQISSRSWWRNLDDGFTYDDNEFRTNQYIHPFNGAAYFNSARSNGLNFWTSSAYGIAGALFWECCGETHPMSFNDLISTGIGGMALGEMQYRLSSEILNNQATGTGRFFKELAGFLVDPVRGFNRLISGRSGAAHDNPSDPMDWRPPHGLNLVMIGARTIGEGESISENTKSYFNIGFDHAYGSPFDNSRRKPFDYMDIALQMSVGEKVPLNVVRISGDLLEKPFGGDAAPNHVLALSQRFDYMNNTAFEFGGQSVGASLYSRFGRGAKWGVTTRLDAMAMILGAVNSDYAQIADVANRERLREYDYGPGLGAAVQANVSRSGRPLLSLMYRFQWIDVRNGSVYSKDQSSFGSDADHYIHAAIARLVIPVFKNFGVGADGGVFLRKSYYSAPGFHDVDQRNPQIRVFLAFNDAH
jgi:hypothetical protein